MLTLTLNSSPSPPRLPRTWPPTAGARLLSRALPLGATEAPGEEQVKRAPRLDAVGKRHRPHVVVGDILSENLGMPPVLKGA